jgi:26S proteasome regulatory subunit T6
MGKHEGMKAYYIQKIEEADAKRREETENLRRLSAQRNELNAKGYFSLSKSVIDVLYAAVRQLREELQLLQEPGSYVGEVVKAMGKDKILVKVGKCFVA